LDQSLPPKEIIVIDDASQDNTTKILSKFQNYIQIYQNSINKGAALTTNLGIKKSSENLISILNSDDKWEIDKLEKQISFFYENDLDVCFGLAEIINESSALVQNPPHEFNNFRRVKPYDNDYLKHFFYKGNFLCHPSILISKRVYESLGTYNNRLRQLPDLDLWVRIAKSNFKMGILPETLVRFRWTPGLNTSDASVFSNFARTQNELSYIYSHFFDNMAPGEISRIFEKELRVIPDDFSKLKSLSPDLALLLFHPDPWMGTQSKRIGISKLYEISDDDAWDLLVQRFGANYFFGITAEQGPGSRPHVYAKQKQMVIKGIRFIRDLKNIK
jgi:glycosyltransferase involved in cell wall biosynthesis